MPKSDCDAGSHPPKWPDPGADDDLKVKHQSWLVWSGEADPRADQLDPRLLDELDHLANAIRGLDDPRPSRNYVEAALAAWHPSPPRSKRQKRGLCLAIALAASLLLAFSWQFVKNNQLRQEPIIPSGPTKTTRTQADRVVAKRLAQPSGQGQVQPIDRDDRPADPAALSRTSLVSRKSQLALPSATASAIDRARSRLKLLRTDFILRRTADAS